MERPFFHVIGAGRSGTSLLSCLIDAHSRCCVDPERHSPLLMGTIETSAENEPDLQARATQRIENYLAACRSSAAEHPDKLWGHKVTTEQISNLREFRGETVGADFGPIASFMERVLDIPTVFIVRDGRACIASKLARTGQALELAIARWKFAVDLQRKFESACKSIMVLKYEALVRDPAGELRRVGRFLGFEYEPAMLGGVNSAKLQTEYRRDGFDVVELGDDPPWVHQIAPELESLGYRAPSRLA